MTTYSKKANAIRAAKKVFGAAATDGVEFVTHQVGDAWTYNGTGRGTIDAAMDAVDNQTPAAVAPKKARKAPAPKTAPAATVAKVTGGKRAAIVADAQRGILPTPPAFPSPNDKRYLAQRDKLVALVDAKDVKTLKALEIPTYSSSPRALARYRDLAVTALVAQGAAL